jgi:hypothetical protein
MKTRCKSILTTGLSTCCIIVFLKKTPAGRDGKYVEQTYQNEGDYRRASQRKMDKKKAARKPPEGF